MKMLNIFVQWLKDRTSNRAEPSLQDDVSNRLTTTSLDALLAKNNQGTKIQISPMPQVLMEEVKSFTVPGKCYWNSIETLRRLKNATKREDVLSYVLGQVTDARDGKTVRHAWIKFGHIYFDPTIEPQDWLPFATHVVKREFTWAQYLEKLEQQMGRELSQLMLEGKVELWSLVFTEKGYVFVEKD